MEKLEKFPFLTKLFQNKKPCQKHHCQWAISEHSKGWSPPNFNTDNVRLVVIQHNQDTFTNTSGGRVLFDSKSEPKPATNNQQDDKKKCLFKPKRCHLNRGQQGADGNTPNSRRPRLASDLKLLEEMMFGSAPMVQKGSSLKVHAIKSPPQVMVTKVFLPTTTNKESAVEHESFDLYSVHSISADSTPKQIVGSDRNIHAMMAQSVPVDVPMPARKQCEDNEDSGISASMASSCSSSFTTSGYSPSSSASMSSVNSRTRRLLRNQTTSFEYSFAKRSSDENGDPLPASQRPPCLGIAITFTLPQEDTEIFRLFESFFFSHITLIESHVVKLKLAVEKALQKHNKHMVSEALDVFRDAIFDLYTAPRLSEPVWLNMMCYTSRQVALYQHFLKDFMSVMDKYDNKNTKFFLSTLVTAVLTHHLAWVPTVSPAGATPSRTYLDKHSAKWLDSLAKSHPYNPLWAQLGDLYGAIGFPLRLSRTVIVGQKADLVCKLLHILSYFIRCSDVHERVEHRQCLDDMDGHIDIPGMITIEEDDISEVGDNISSGRRYGSATYGSATYGSATYGSATSYGTVRHASMQASTETVLSAKSDGTVIDRYMDDQIGSTRSADGIDAKSLSNAPSMFREKSLEEPCSCQSDTDGLDTEFCATCRELWESSVVQHDEQSVWKYGRSVFFCCIDDVNGTRQEGICQCNFDLEVNYNDINDKNEASNIDCDNEQSELDTSCDIVTSATSKPLLLFRMLSKEPFEGEDICDTTFSHDGDNEGKTANIHVPKLSHTIDKPSPHELFTALHAESLPTIRMSESTATITSETTKQDPISSQSALPSTNVLPSQDGIPSQTLTTSESAGTITQSDGHGTNNQVECKLLPADGIENRVKVIRTRHVGHLAGVDILPIELDEQKNLMKDVSVSQVSKVLDDKELGPTKTESCSDLICDEKSSRKSSDYIHELCGVTIDPTIVTSGEATPTCIETEHAVDNTKSCEVDMACNATVVNVELTPKPAESTYIFTDQASLLPIVESSESCELPQAKRTTLYPSLNDKVGEVSNVQLGIETNVISPNHQEKALPSLYPSVSYSTVSPQTPPSLIDCSKCDPGAVKLVEADLGTLYPLIIDNTVISSKPSVQTVDLSNSDTMSSKARSPDASQSNSNTMPSKARPQAISQSNSGTMSSKASSRGVSQSNSDISLGACISGGQLYGAIHETYSSNQIQHILINGENTTEVDDEEESELDKDLALGSVTMTDTNVTADNALEEQTRILTTGYESRAGTIVDVNADKLSQHEARQSPTHAKVQAWLRTTSESSSSLSENEVNPVKDEPGEQTKSVINSDVPAKQAYQPVGKLSQRALMDRQDSTFDEYFNDDSIDLPAPHELYDKASITACNLCQRSCSHDSNNSVFLSDDMHVSDCSHSAYNKSTVIKPVKSHTLDMMDGYFTEDVSIGTLPDGPTKDVITNTLNLMQGEHHLLDDDVTMDDVLDGMVGSRSRSNSGNSITRMKSFNRQQSSGSAVSQLNNVSNSTPARCRTVTPVELGRRRHQSSTSTVSREVEAPDTKPSVKNIPLPRSISTESAEENSTSFKCDFGHSLLAGYTDHYMSDFVLHGTSESSHSLLSKLHGDLSITVQNSVLDEPITEACCIVADTDKWNIRLHTCQRASPDRMRQMDLSASQMVCSILESVHKLWKMKMSPEFCLMHLEDRLQEMYFKSKMLSEYIYVHQKLDLKELSTTLGFDVSDMPLLLAVAGTHSPNLALALLN